MITTCTKVPTYPIPKLWIVRVINVHAHKIQKNLRNTSRGQIFCFPRISEIMGVFAHLCLICYEVGLCLKEHLFHNGKIFQKTHFLQFEFLIFFFFGNINIQRFIIYVYHPRSIAEGGKIDGRRDFQAVIINSRPSLRQHYTWISLYNWRFPLKFPIFYSF